MNGDDTKSAALCGWVKCWHARGVLVTLPVGIGFDYVQASQDIDAALAAGWLPREIGLEAGEMKEEVGWVARSTTTGRTGLADVIAYYSTNESWTKPFLTDYLNTEADRQEFQAATGINPASIPEYIGEGRLERGKNPKTDQLIVKLPKPVSLVMKPNPKYSEAEATACATAVPKKVYKVAKKLFVRWDSMAQPVVAPERETGGVFAVLHDLWAEYEKLIPTKQATADWKSFIKWATGNEGGLIEEIPADLHTMAQDHLRKWIKAAEAAKRKAATI